MAKAKAARDVEKDIPSAGWQLYVSGRDAFDKKEGYGWFQVELPVVPPGARQARLHFASVDEDATVFINGRRAARHEGWNAPFDILVDRMDTLQQPVVLTVFVGNHSNEGGIDQPVRIAALVSPVEVKGWRMRGGTGDTSARGWVNARISGLAAASGDSGHAEGPCWWKTDFSLPVNAGLRPEWRGIPKELRHGFGWGYGYKPGRGSEKVTGGGVYNTRRWLRPRAKKLQLI